MAQSSYDLSLNIPSSRYSDQHQPPPAERQPIVRSRANITSACLACKRRKRKCLGGAPCPHCASLRIQCSYDERLDKRRKAFSDKARAEIDFQRRLLDGLIKAIKSEHAPTILDMVRQDASLEEIAGRLDDIGMLAAITVDYPEYARRRSHDSERSVAQVQPNHMTTLGTEPEASHALSINQLLAPRLQEQHRPSINSSMSIPSLSEILIEAQGRRRHDEETAHAKTSASFPQELDGPRLTPFSARIDAKSPGAGQPSLTSHPPQDRTSGLTHAQSPIHMSDRRLTTSPI